MGHPRFPYYCASLNQKYTPKQIYANLYEKGKKKKGGEEEAGKYSSTSLKGHRYLLTADIFL